MKKLLSGLSQHRHWGKKAPWLYSLKWKVLLLKQSTYNKSKVDLSIPAQRLQFSPPNRFFLMFWEQLWRLVSLWCSFAYRSQALSLISHFSLDFWFLSPWHSLPILAHSHSQLLHLQLPPLLHFMAGCQQREVSCKWQDWQLLPIFSTSINKFNNLI